MHKGYCIKIANFVHPLQVGVARFKARFKAIDVRVASSFRSQVKTLSINMEWGRAEVSAQLFELKNRDWPIFVLHTFLFL